MASSKDRRDYENNKIAYVALCCGAASLVPLVILATFLPAIVFGIGGLITAARKPGHPGRGAATIGIVLAVAALLMQAIIASFAGLLGFL